MQIEGTGRADAVDNESMNSNGSRKIDIWLIEDNDAFRNALARVLNQIGGLRCSHTFSSCEAALEVLKADLAPHVILLDVGLPGMSGIEGIGRIKAHAPETHILMLTMFDDHDKVFRSICAGASGYLLKTSPKQKIADAIREVLDGGAPMNPQIARSVIQMFTKMAAPKHDYGLTAREKEVLDLMVQGKIKKEIADHMSLSYHTIDTHLRNIYQKLHVHSGTGAVAKALRERLF
jgi:DNA-binding NarL/FixJ family response regulator